MTPPLSADRVRALLFPHAQRAQDRPVTYHNLLRQTGNVAGHKPISEAIKSSIIEMATRGLRRKDIARHHGVSISTVVKFAPPLSETGKKARIGLPCPKCGLKSKHRVIECRGTPGQDSIWRRRICECGERFTTMERVGV